MESMPERNFKYSFKAPHWDEFTKMVDGIWDREYYTNHGPLAVELERKIEQELGVKHAVCMTNSSIALMIASLALEIKGNAILSCFSHINHSESLAWAGIENSFCDIELDAPNISIDELQLSYSSDVELIVAHNIFGFPCKIGELESFARDKGLKLMFISDGLLGSTYMNRTFGSFGDLEIFSFHQTLPLNGGDGACITTNSDELAARLRNIRSSYGAGKVVQVPFTGNGRMSEIQAGMVLLSYNHLKENNAINKRRLQKLQETCLNTGFKILVSDEVKQGLNITDFVFQISDFETRTSFKDSLNKRELFYYDLGCFGTKTGNCTNTVFWQDNSIVLPCNQFVRDQDFSTLIDICEKFSN